MAEDDPVEKSLLDQILDTMFAGIDAKDEFTSGTLSRLRALRAAGGLTRPAEVAEAMKERSEGLP